MRILMFFAGDVTEIDGYLAGRLHDDGFGLAVDS
jgi:hypothetical protein